MTRNEINIAGKRIAIIGHETEVQYISEGLTHLDLTGSEGEDRLKIQQYLDEKRWNSTILYSGNTVYPSKYGCDNLKTIVKHGDMTKMKKPLYQFLSLNCGSIAHYNMHGWIDEYPTLDHLRRFFRTNEFGQNVLDYQPAWATDIKVVVRNMMNILSL